MFIQNVKLAIRNLKRHKLYSILSITGFSVGFAVCLYIALFIYNELSMDRCFPWYPPELESGRAESGGSVEV